VYVDVSPPDAIRPIRGLTERAFRRLLDWLADGAAESHGEAYLEMRRRLVLYFHRRNRSAPDELADETLNRIATTLEERGAIAITPPTRYSYIVARFVFLEDLRRQEHSHVSLDPRSADSLQALGVREQHPIDGVSLAERRFRCLERCLDTLEPAQRMLIVEYYRGIGREKIELRRALAARLEITTNALGIRASRIREALVRCIDACDKDVMT
jgi:DNA-directed RNA polymerase specialized sigma24 family protein